MEDLNVICNCSFCKDGKEIWTQGHYYTIDSVYDDEFEICSNNGLDCIDKECFKEHFSICF